MIWTEGERHSSPQENRGALTRKGKKHRIHYIPVFTLGQGTKTWQLTLKGDPVFGSGCKIGVCPRERGKKSIFESRVEMRAAMLSLKLMKSVHNPEAH